MKKLYSLSLFVLAGLIIITLLALPDVSADSSGGFLTGKVNSCIKLPQECASCTYVKMTTITIPDLTQLSIQTNMIQDGTSYSYNFCNTTQVGSYSYCMVGDVGGTATAVCNSFTISFWSLTLLIIGIVIALLFIGFGILREDATFLGLGNFVVYGLAIFTLIYGIDIYQNNFTLTIGVVLLGLAFYLSYKIFEAYWADSG